MQNKESFEQGLGSTPTSCERELLMSHVASCSCFCLLREQFVFLCMEALTNLLWVAAAELIAELKLMVA